jgi:hypothetical protein
LMRGKKRDWRVWFGVEFNETELGIGNEGEIGGTGIVSNFTV